MPNGLACRFSCNKTSDKSLFCFIWLLVPGYLNVGGGVCLRTTQQRISEAGVKLTLCTDAKQRQLRPKTSRQGCGYRSRLLVLLPILSSILLQQFKSIHDTNTFLLTLITRTSQTAKLIKRNLFAIVIVAINSGIAQPYCLCQSPQTPQQPFLQLHPMKSAWKL